MNVFISYSVTDESLVRTAVDALRPHVTKVNWWAESQSLGDNAWQSIESWIDQSDVVLALITDHAVSRAMAVGNEIGRAKAQGKLIIPLVTEGVPDSALGCLQGVTYQKLDHDNPGPALSAVIKRLERLKVQQRWQAIGGIVAIFSVIGLLLLGDDEEEEVEGTTNSSKASI